jgi:hypothetical protein
MRGLGSLVGILVVALAAAMVYKYFLASGQTTGAATPIQTIDAVGAQNDLIAIAQAERAYQAEHGKYVSLDELVSGGAMQMRKPSREGYAYEVDPSDTGFRATARCSTALPGCHNYFVDETMTVQIAP